MATEVIKCGARAEFAYGEPGNPVVAIKCNVVIDGVDCPLKELYLPTYNHTDPGNEMLSMVSLFCPLKPIGEVAPSVEIPINSGEGISVVDHSNSAA